MSDLKVFVVNTKGKKSLKRPFASDLSNGQNVRFSDKEIAANKWVQGAIAAGNLVPVTEKGKTVVKETSFSNSEEPGKKKKEAKKSKEAVVEEAVVEEAVVEEAVVEEAAPAVDETPVE